MPRSIILILILVLFILIAITIIITWLSKSSSSSPDYQNHLHHHLIINFMIIITSLSKSPSSSLLPSRRQPSIHQPPGTLHTSDRYSLPGLKATKTHLISPHLDDTGQRWTGQPFFRPGRCRGRFWDNSEIKFVGRCRTTKHVSNFWRTENQQNPL